MAPLIPAQKTLWDLPMDDSYRQGGGYINPLFIRAMFPTAACGPNIPNQIALSQNLFFKPNGGNRCGQEIIIRLSDGQVIHGTVWDTMNAEWRNSADVLTNGVSRAIDFGDHQGQLIFVDHYTKNTNIANEI